MCKLPHYWTYDPDDKTLTEGNQTTPAARIKYFGETICIYARKSTIKVTCLLQQLMRKFRAKKKALPMVSIDMEMVCERV